MAETLKLDDANGVQEQLRKAVRAKFRPALVVMSGERVGVRASVQSNVTVGRDGDSTLVLPDQGVSSRHAIIQDRGDSFVLVDLDSTNGTFVNGQRVSEAELRNGDKLGFGTTMVRFEVQDEADRAYSEMIEELVHIDDLTGLYLRRRFDAELTARVTTAKAGAEPLALLAMDLDGVKNINDTHGHLFGARTIAECGKTIGRMIAGKGFATRFGGDEFVAALPGHGPTEGYAFAREVCSFIGSEPIRHEGILLNPGISIGVATFPEDAADAVELFRRADEALYLAKRTGKRRVCRYADLKRP
ncbi:MAG TPA: GGDEF domain-containing protein [Polyangiaceae bacterium]|jgi:diguanylate cyclase (GGDEF)-like protein|nr:GGDEF domain-containing protein [Polyangiaceae bacterium]